MNTKRSLTICLSAVLMTAVLITASSPALADNIVAWGNNDRGQCDVPAGNDFVAIDAAEDHSLALRADGSIAAWGCVYPFDNGQCDVPAPNTDFVAIATGPYHSLGLKADGSIAAWGCVNPDYGQCDVPAGNDFVAIAAGPFHSLALKSDGSIVGWGSAFNIDFYGEAMPPAGNDFVAIAAGGSISLALTSDGSIVQWYQNWGGQCDVPEPNTDFVAIAVGAPVPNVMAVKEDGSIVAVYLSHPLPEPNTDFVAVVVGGGIVPAWYLGLKSDGSIVEWGYGQCDAPAGNDFVAIAGGAGHRLALLRPSDPVAAMQFLIADVMALNLQQGIENSLDSKLDAAQQALDDVNNNNNVAAINALGAFINAVAAQSGVHIPVDDANALIAAAQQIIDMLNAT